MSFDFLNPVGLPDPLGIDSHAQSNPYLYPGSYSFNNPTGTISPNDPDYASKTEAQLSREMWDDYVQRFEPYEQQLATMVTDPSVLAGDITQADSDVNAAYATTAAENQRHIARLGLPVNQQQSQYFARSNDLSRASAQAAAENAARMNWQNRNLSAMAGGPGFGVAQQITTEVQ